MNPPIIEVFFDPDTFTLSYLVIDPATKATAIIDPVLDFTPSNGRTATTSAEKLLKVIAEKKLHIKWILESHAHADHLSSSQFLQQKFAAPIAIGASITEVQKVFNNLFNLSGNEAGHAEDFNQLLKHGDKLALGELSIEVLHTPGHTPACLSYKVEDAIFVGDTLFMPDYGTARCDFPGGDAATLFDSIQFLLSFPEKTRLFMCHDYMPNGRKLQWVSSVAEQKKHNIHLQQDIAKETFIKMRVERDATLSAPKLILPAIQVNIRAGKLPVMEDNDVSYLKLPMDKI